MNLLPDLISDLIKKQYIENNLKSYLLYGRLCCHERIKASILEIGAEQGYNIAPEYRVKYFLERYRSGRIDAVWLDGGKPYALFEIEEGLNTRGFCKLIQTPAAYKFLVMFDVKRKMQQQVDRVDFASKGIIPIHLDK